MWDYSEGDVWVKKLVGKHPRRFIFTPERELRLLTPSNMIEGEPVPDRKFIVFTYGSTDNPYGKGLGQRLWWPVWFKKHGVKYWVVFGERFGSPTTVGKYPRGSGKPEQDKLLAALEAIQKETGIIIPEDLVIELLEAARKTSTDTYEKLCQFMDLQISKAVLGQTLTTEVGERGSYAASKTHEDVRQDIVKADADLLCELLNNTLIPWLVDYNHPDVRAYPQIWIHTEEEEDLKPLAERDKILTKDVGLPVSKQYFYDTYNIPKPEEGEELVSPPAPGAGPGFAEDVKKNSPVRKAIEAQDKVDRLVDTAASEAAPLFENFTDVIDRAAGKADSLAELDAGIPELYGELDPLPMMEHLAGKLLEADRIGADSVLAELTAKERASVLKGRSFQEGRWGPGLPFKEAIDYFRDRAFWITGITRAEFLGEVKDELAKSMAEGLTLRDFRRALPGIFERHGYSMLHPWRIETIYRTNLQNAHQAGRQRQMTDPAVLQARPFWRYVAVQDVATRPEHAAMHGRVFRADNPVWESWYPPNGFNCRCTVQTLSAREVQRRGLKVETEDPTGKLFEPVDPETGARLPARPLFPDRGWTHRPEEMDLKALLARKKIDLGILEEEVVPEVVPETYTPTQDFEEARRWARANGVEIVHQGPMTVQELNQFNEEYSRVPRPIRQAIKDRHLREHIAANDGITVDPDLVRYRGRHPRGWPAGYTWDRVPACGGNRGFTVVINKGMYQTPGMPSAVIHEVGHVVDYNLLGDMSESPQWKAILRGYKSKIVRAWGNYYKYPEEIFASAFSQYFYSAETRAALKKLAPRVHDFFEQLVERLSHA
jgi:SPP1 gp7 family putative phage head morphogenesis protein